MFKLPDLPYDYSALEPYIDSTTMKLHHDKHHGTYVEKLNKALEGHEDLVKKSIGEILSDLNQVPDDIRSAIRNHGGGHANHSFFWEIMAPASNQVPEGEIAKAIEGTFGNYENFVEQFSNSAINHFGSGWAWLTIRGSELKIQSLANQDSPLTGGEVPILGLDVWEHAYYLKYQNRRADYVKAWWNVVNWKKVGELFENASTY
jgi:Fe-Mn family superoxide dismutase